MGGLPTPHPVEREVPGGRQVGVGGGQGHLEPDYWRAVPRLPSVSGGHLSPARPGEEAVWRRHHLPRWPVGPPWGRIPAAAPKGSLAGRRRNNEEETLHLILEPEPSWKVDRTLPADSSLADRGLGIFLLQKLGGTGGSQLP